MHQVAVTKILDVTPDRAWEIVDDFGGVYRYHPRVDRSPLLSEVSAGLGAKRTCHFDDGSAIVEEVTAYEPGREYEVTIVDPGAFPLHSAIGRIVVEPAGVDRSRVTFAMSFEPKFGIAGWLMGKTVMAAQFKRILETVIDGIGEHAHTGAVVSRRRAKAAA